MEEVIDYFNSLKKEKENTTKQVVQSPQPKEQLTELQQNRLTDALLWNQFDEPGTDPNQKIKYAPYIMKSNFRRDAGEVADVLSFQKEFLNRNLSALQKEAYLALWGSKGGEWSTQYFQSVLLVGMKGGKNFWMEGDIAYTAYFISMLKDPHDFFTRLTKRLLPYPKQTNFDIPLVTGVNELQTKFVGFNGVHRVLRNTMDPKNREDNWFEKYVGLDLRKTYGAFTRNEIIFPSRVKNSSEGVIRIFGMNHSPSTAEGLHMIRFYADELSRAETKAAYKAARKSLSVGIYNTTASFPNSVGKVIQFSYPNAVRWDVVHEDYLKGKEIDSIYALKAATYEFNPTLTKELLSTLDPESEEFKLKYECIKPVKHYKSYKEFSDSLNNR